MLRFEVHPVIQDMLEIQRADHFLCYVSRSALPLEMLEMQSKSKPNKQSKRKHPPPHSWMQCMSMGIVCCIKMNICQQENVKKPPTFITTRVQSGIEHALKGYLTVKVVAQDVDSAGMLANKK